MILMIFTLLVVLKQLYQGILRTRRDSKKLDLKDSSPQALKLIVSNVRSYWSVILEANS
jgi:hypothetical protein